MRSSADAICSRKALSGRLISDISMMVSSRESASLALGLEVAKQKSKELSSPKGVPGWTASAGPVYSKRPAKFQR
jgi:hypothetical protein